MTVPLLPRGNAASDVVSESAASAGTRNKHGRPQTERTIRSEKCVLRPSLSQRCLVCFFRATNTGKHEIYRSGDACLGGDTRRRAADDRRHPCEWAGL